LHLIQKLAPFGETTPGLSAIDTFLSLGIHLVKQNNITPDVLIGAITHRAANIFKLPGGTLSVGANADVCIVDPNQFWQVTDETLMSMGKNTPFKEWELPGKVTATFLQGHLVYDATRNIHP
jgi:dihydroorotase